MPPWEKPEGVAKLEPVPGSGNGRVLPPAIGGNELLAPGKGAAADGNGLKPVGGA